MSADGLLPQLPRPFHELGDAGQSVQEAVFGVKVKVSKHLHLSGDTHYSAAARERSEIMLIWREFFEGPSAPRNWRSARGGLLVYGVVDVVEQVW